MNLIDSIIDSWLTIGLWVVDLLPDCDSFPVEWNTAFSSFVSFLSKANTIFPVDTLLIQFSLLLPLMAGVLIFEVFVFLLRFFKN